MSEIDFEGTIILEKMAEIDLLDDFYEAIDADNLYQVEILLRKADIDDETIEEVLRQIEEGS
jgi:hypothetical protein